MQLEHKPDFEDAKRYWQAYWAGEIIDRPCVCLRVRNHDAPTPPPSVNGFEDFEDVLTRYEKWASHVLWLAEAIPFFQPNFGPDQFAAWLGGDLRRFSFQDGTSWAVPTIADWSSDAQAIDRPHGMWWELVLEFHQQAADYSGGKFLIGVPDIHSNMDALSALRGPEKLCTDLLDAPERIDTAMKSVRRAFAPVFEGVEKAARMAKRGYISWLPFYCEERFAVLECDFACMVSPEHFRRWILPALDEESSYLDHCVYHYDGPDALVHLKDVLSIAGIDAIQWVPGAGNPPVIGWMDLLLEMQKAGKGLYIAASPDEVKVYHRALKPKGVLYDVWASSEQEAQDLLAWLRANT